MNTVRNYYERSQNELAQRYIKEHEFLSREFCDAALDHRYRLYPFIDEFVRFESWSGRRVLEVGCGQGADLSRFALAGAETYGCDIARRHCLVSREFVECMGGSAAVLQADARGLPFRSESFDLVYSFGVLLLIDELQSALEEIRRVLKPGGTLIAMFYNRLSLHYLLKTLCFYGIVCDLEELLGPRRLVDWFTDGYGYPTTHHQTRETLRSALGGFEIERLVARNLTADQTPLIDRQRYPEAFWGWLSSRLGFYLLVRARK